MMEYLFLMVLVMILLIFVSVACLLERMSKSLKEIETHLWHIRHIELHEIKNEQFLEFRKRNEREFK
ncbi:hypothetical protein [Priestia megaterium]|uniref:hypothetical protein n=1 Tax=Priestia megaterium TaxID=1404 RepID=UPI000CA305C7|nr:hypothetical protein [Priestia megaterium]AUO14777.1 hypothetical protein C0569_26175 [Priestia megaterium]